MISDNFDDWVYCLTQKCKIKLDSTFAKKRLSILEDSNHEETQKFKELYGEQHLENVIHWFKQIV